jgi:DNA-binding NarL/FixJ family response regulator
MGVKIPKYLYNLILYVKKADITEKQLEVLHLIADGYNSEEIADKLGNSKKTIDAIRIEMLNRFQVKNAAHLVSYGFRKKWLK